MPYHKAFKSTRLQEEGRKLPELQWGAVTNGLVDGLAIWGIQRTYPDITFFKQQQQQHANTLIHRDIVSK